jgi:hypothetical protein
LGSVREEKLNFFDLQSMTDKQQLISMGFAEDLVASALKATKNAGLQPAMDWMLANPNGVHAEEPKQGDEEDGEISTEQQSAQSLMCDDCGKILRDGDAAQFHAVKTNHTNFSESLKEIAKLTPEEKAAKIKELEVRLAARREEKRLLAIQESKQKETIRRTTGAEMQLMKEKMEQDNMAKEAALRKKQKQDDREAIIAVRKQLEADKKERQREAEEKKMAAQGIAIPKAAVVKPVIQDVNYSESRIQVLLN